MATHHVNLSFTIYINDPGYFQELLDANFYDPTSFDGFARAPMEAAATVGSDLFARGHWPTDVPIPIDITVNAFRTPSIRSDVLQPNVPSGTYPIDVIQFKRKSGGWFGVPWLFGDTTIYTWIPHYEYSPPLIPVVPGPPTPVPMPTRRWLDGAETPLQGEGASGGQAAPARRASRHTQGFGFLFDNTVDTRTHSHTENGTPGTAQGAWERLYIRFVRFPDASIRIWRATSTLGAGGPLITITTTGALLLNDYDGFSTAAPIGTFGAALILNKWYKLDLIYSYGTATLPVTLPFFKAYINGALMISTGGGALPNMGGATKKVASSVLGGGTINGSANNGIWHADDWIGAEIPPATYDIGGCADFTHGSRVALIGANGFGALHNAAWNGGDWRLTRQRPVQTGVAQQLKCAVSGALLSLTTDAAIEIDAQPNQLGIAALNIALYSTTGGAGAAGLLGYGFNGGAPTLGAVSQGAGLSAFAWGNVLYKGGTIAPLTPMAGLELTFQKAATTDNAQVQAVQAVAEIIGVFGEEDVYPLGATGLPIADAPVGSITPHLGIHNAPYPHTVWAEVLQPPESPIVVKTGQYTGNGIGQDIKFRCPVTFLWIRPMTGGAGGGLQWWSSCNSTHQHGMRAYAPDTFLEILIDPTFASAGTANTEGNMDPLPAPDNLEQALAESNALAYGFAKNTEDYEPWTHYLEDPDYYWRRMLGQGSEGGPDQALAGLYAVPPSPWFSTQVQQTLVRVAGANVESNANGVVYSYVAFCDPGMRFSQAGALATVDFAGAFDSALDIEQFTPESAFVQTEIDAASTQQTLMFKGLGSAADAISLMTLAEIASGLTFGTGKMTFRQGLGTPSPGSNQHAYLAVRRDDGSGAPGVASVVQLATWTGDGTASRNIPLLNTSGKRPMWAIVVGHNGVTVTRDPYHTATNSSQFPNNGFIANGITAGGIDFITIGTQINASGIKYDVLVFPGGTAACNNGWSCPGEFFPVPPTAPPDGTGPWNPPPPEPPPPPGGGGAVCSTSGFPIDPDV